MRYAPMREILAELDVQQRRERTSLAGEVDEAELNRVRHARKQISRVATFFIEQTWEILAPELAEFSLEAETGRSGPEICDYLERLRRRQAAFAWGWVRARMSSRLMRRLEILVPELLDQHPEMAACYVQCLRQVDRYWFRASPLHDLKAGYHTALGVACKWYGAVFEAAPQPIACRPDTLRAVRDDLRRYASFSMTMLTRTDGFLWDSAGAEPLDAIGRDGEVLVANRSIEELVLATAPDYGVRLGCPALRARRQGELPAFDGIVTWVEQVFCRYLSC